MAVVLYCTTIHREWLSIGLGLGYRQSIRMAIISWGESGRINNATDIARGTDDHTFHLGVTSVQACSRLLNKFDWGSVGRQNQ